MRLEAIVITSLSLTACGGPAAPAPSLDLEDLPATVTLAVGESQIVGRATATFTAVENDSRCPVDVVCVWAGNAEALLAVTADGTSQTIELNSSLDPRTAVAAGIRFTLVALAPEPRSSDTQRAYRATLRIERDR